MNFIHKKYIIVIRLFFIAAFVPAIFTGATANAQEVEISATHGNISSEKALIIKDVEIRGMPIGEAQFLKQLNIQRGDAFNQAIAREGLKKLYELGEFSDISLFTRKTGDGVTLIFDVEPIRKILKVNLIGNEVISSSEILITAELNEGADFTHRKKQTAINKIANLYNRSGYKDVEVDISALPIGETDTIVELFIYEGAPTIIKSINFDGAGESSKNQLRSLISQKPGRVLDINTVEQDIKKLREIYHGRGFREVKINPNPLIAYNEDDTANITINIESGARVDVIIEGNLAKPTKALEKAVELEKVYDFSKGGVNRLAANMLKYLNEEGFLNASVEGSLTEKAGGKRKEARFIVTEGERCRISKVFFKGNQFEKSEDLNKLLSGFVFTLTQGENALSRINPIVADELGFSGGRQFTSGDGVRNSDPLLIYNKKTYQKAVAMIQERLHKMGYLSARVKLKREVYNPTKSRVILVIKAVEGVRTIVEKIIFNGGAILPNSFNIWKSTRQSAPFDMLEAEQKRLEMARFYNNLGYIFNRIGLTMDFSEDRSRVILNFNILEGPQVHISRLIFKGYRKTKPAVINENLVLDPGDIYMPEKVEESRRNLFKLGIFKSASIRPARPDVVEEKKAVVVEVDERSFQAFEIGPGLSTEDGARVFAEYQHLNLNGYALQLSMRGRLSYQIFDFLLDELQAERLKNLPITDVIERRIDIGLSWPRILYFPRYRRFPYKVGTRLNLIHQRENTRAYGLDRNSIIPGIDFEFVPSLILSLQYELELTLLEVLASKDEVILNQKQRDVLLLPEGNALFGTVKPAIIFDRRDNLFNPRKGYFAAFTTEFTDSITGELKSSFIKMYGKFNFYIPAAKMLVFAASLQAGNIFSTAETSVDGEKQVDQLSENEKIIDERARTPLNKRFYLGGRGTLRGYYEKSLVPAFSQTPANRLSEIQGLNAQVQTFGGNTFTLAKLEARIRITSTFGFALFTDIGGLWLRWDDMELGDMRKTVGGGIRYDTPVGPLSLDIGVGLSPDYAINEPAYAVHFSIGSF